jgi:hypothetical protein
MFLVIILKLKKNEIKNNIIFEALLEQKKNIQK